MNRQRGLLTFIGTNLIVVGVLLLFLQSKYFATVLTRLAKKYTPADIGVEAKFEELSIKMFPPAIMLKKPALSFKEKNPLGLPIGTDINANSIQVSFQGLQMLAGIFKVNAFIVDGANFKLELDDEFFRKKEKAPKKKGFFQLSSSSQINFRSITLLNSKVDITLRRKGWDGAVHVKADANELTVSQSTVGLASLEAALDLALDFQNADIQTPFLSKTIEKLQLSAGVSFNGISLRNFSLQSGELTINSNGSVHGNLLNPTELQSQFNLMLRGELSEWLQPELFGKYLKLPDKDVPKGQLLLEGFFTGDLLRFEKTVSAKARIQLENAQYKGWALKNVNVRGGLKDGVLVVDKATVSIADGMLEVSQLSYSFFAQSQKTQMLVNLDKIDLRKVLGPLVEKVYPLHLIASGKIESEIVLDKDWHVGGEVDLQINDFSLDNQHPKKPRPYKRILGVKEVFVKGGFDLDSSEIIFDNAVVSIEKTRLLVNGGVDFEKGLGIDAKGNIRLEEIGKLADIEIAGEGDLHWTITGKAPHIFLNFEPELSNASYLNLNLGDVRGKIVWDDHVDTLRFQSLVAKQGRTELTANGTVNLGKEEDVALDIKMPKGTITDVANLLQNFIRDKVDWYPWELTGGISGPVKVVGKTDTSLLSIEGDFILENVELWGESFRAVKVHGGFRKGGFVAENIVAQKKNGLLKGEVILSPDDLMHFKVRSEGLTTGDLDTLSRFEIPYRAPISISVDGNGKFGEVKSNWNFQIGDGSVRQHFVQSSELKIETEKGTLRAEGSIFGRQATGTLECDSSKESSCALTGSANELDFKPILFAINTGLIDDQTVHTAVTGNFSVRFPAKNPVLANGSVSLAKYKLERAGFQLLLQKPVLIELRNGDYDLSQITFSGPDSHLEISGSVHKGKIAQRIKGQINLKILELMIQDFQKVKGFADVDVVFSGSVDDPRAHGNLSAGDVDVLLKVTEQPLEDIRFNGVIRDNLIEFPSVHSKFAGGAISGSGRVVLSSKGVPDLKFKFDLNNSKIKVYPVTYARTSGTIAVEGDELPYLVKGKATIHEALVQEEFGGGNLKTLKTSKFLPTKKKGGVKSFQLFEMDLSLTADRNIFVRNSLFDAELKGNLVLSNDPKTPRLLGNVYVLQGKILFKESTFNVQTGTLKFVNPSVIDPEIDLTAQTETKGYKVFVVAQGKSSDPRIQFESQPQLTQQDIVSLLTLGVTSSDIQSISRTNRGAVTRDEMYGLIFSQSGLNKGLQEKLGVRVSVDQAQPFAPDSAFRARGSGGNLTETTSPKVVLQKSITKDLKASVGSTIGVGGNREQNVGLEYNLGKRWSVLGVYEDQRGPQPNNSRTSVGADLKYRLRFK
ncbi:MAG: translocation/assembly module TamB domain-containing protein [Bacteriovoracia bacterium]